MDDASWTEVVATVRGLDAAAGRGDATGAHVLLPLPDVESARVMATITWIAHDLLVLEANRQRVSIDTLLERALSSLPTQGDPHGTS